MRIVLDDRPVSLALDAAGRLLVADA
jgi:hypothetical protein